MSATDALDRHLRAALDAADDPETRYHIREAMQATVVVELEAFEEGEA